MTRLTAWFTLAVALAAFTAAPVAGAQEPPPGGGMQQMPMYDIKNETSFKGTVEAVEQVTPEGRMAGRMGGRSMTGTHVRLKTASGTFEVHLGPTSYLEEKKLKLEKGEEIEVLGSRIRMADDYVVLAREVRRGGETWTLRDENGRPLWRMGRR